MIELLLSVAFLLLGLLMGAVGASMFWIYNSAKLSKGTVEKLLVESGYEIKDGKIVPAEREAA